jgi:ribosomal protein L7/L12
MLYIWGGLLLLLIVAAMFLASVLALLRIEAKVDRLLRQIERPEDVAKQVPLSVQDLARAGLKLEAIRQYREETGCSLMEAKQVVEAFIESRESV